MPLLTDLSDEARAIGSVNTVVFAGGRRAGHNTDWSGFRQSVRDRLPGAGFGRVVQLGAGGAGAATAYAMLDLGVRELIVVDTIHERASSLANRLAAAFSGRVRAERDVSAALPGAEGLIHATPTGMPAYPGLPLPASLLRAGPLGRRGRVFPPRDRTAARRETTRMPDARRWGDGRVSGGGGVSIVHGAAGRRREDAGRLRIIRRVRLQGGIVERPRQNPRPDLAGRRDQLPGSRRAGDRGAVDPAAVRVEPGRDGRRVLGVLVDVLPRPGAVRRPAGSIRHAGDLLALPAGLVARDAPARRRHGVCVASGAAPRARPRRSALFSRQQQRRREVVSTQRAGTRDRRLHGRRVRRPELHEPGAVLDPEQPSAGARCSAPPGASEWPPRSSSPGSIAIPPIIHP